MFCAPPVEAAVAGGNARWGEGTIAPCARSPAPVRRHRRAAAIDERYRWTAPSRSARACRLPALRFF